MHSRPPPLSIYCGFRDTEPRRLALQEWTGGELPNRGLFSGVDVWAEKGNRIQTNLDRPPGRICHQIGHVLNLALHRLGGWGGDFSTLLTTRRAANRADVIFSSVDTVGIPLALLSRFRLIRPPLVYVSIGLPERLERMNSPALRRVQLRAIARAERILCYGWQEAEELRNWFPDTPVHFIPYGVDTTAWKPREGNESVDVLSLGLDEQRDFGLLQELAAQHPALSFKLITHPHLIAPLGDLPGNIQVSGPVPLETLPDEMAAARVMALPVKENRYSGGTTTLLQSMAMEKAVVVSETGAIQQGYGFQDHEVCRLIPPGDVDAFGSAILDLLSNPGQRSTMGKNARAHVETHLNWIIFADTLLRHVSEAVESG